MAQHLRALATLQRTWVWFPAPTWQLPTMCNSNSKRWNSCILLVPGEYVVHRHTCRQSTHTHGWNKKFSKLPVRVGENTSSAVHLHSLDSCRGWRAPAACALAPTPHESLHLEGVTDTCLQYEHHFELWSADKVSRPFVGLRRTLSITTVLHHWRWASRSETRDWVSTWWPIHRIMAGA